MILRRLSERDMPKVLSIIEEAKAFLKARGVDQWQDGYPNERVMRADMARGMGYVLEGEDGILGIASLVFDGEPTYAKIHGGAWTSPEPYACIHRIAVSAACRGRGVADALMAEAERAVRARGVRSIRIDTHRDNKAMQGMLRRNGYAPCGVIYLETGAERLAFEKTLQL